jgi:hypothetical protein
VRRPAPVVPSGTVSAEVLPGAKPRPNEPGSGDGMGPVAAGPVGSGTASRP